MTVEIDDTGHVVIRLTQQQAKILNVALSLRKKSHYRVIERTTGLKHQEVKWFIDNLDLELWNLVWRQEGEDEV